MHDEEFIQSFVEEAKAHIEVVEAELINIDFNNIDMESINNIFRAVHTIKGTSSFFDFKKIVELSHALENLFGEIRSGNIVITNDMVDTFLKANDCLRDMIEDIASSEEVDITGHVLALNRFFRGEEKLIIDEDDESEDMQVFNIDRYLTSIEKKELLNVEIRRGCYLYLIKKSLNDDLNSNHLHLSELIEEIQSLGSVINFNVDVDSYVVKKESEQSKLSFEILFTTVLEKDFLPEIISEPEETITELHVKEEASSIETLEEIIDPKNTEVKTEKNILMEVSKSTVIKKSKAKGMTAVAEDNVRVNVNLLNTLLNLSGEMVLARNQLFRRMEGHRKNIQGIDVIFQNINNITTNLQETIMLTRMQPVSNVFNKFPRIAREISKSLNKDLVLELEGTEVELDKSIVEALGDPLTHLVRNAIDHGMELPDERILINKPRTGTIQLKAYHESGYVNIDIVDDGKGINTKIIRKKAFEKGFISETDVDVLGEQESLQLLFKPGFSTAEAVTNLSGRGVGMDVVKTNIEKLGGKIEIFTILGIGTTFRLLLPLTLAIIPSLIVESQQQKFVLPQINVQEIVRIKANDPDRKIELINNAEVIRLRNRLLPIVRLADILGLKRTFIDSETNEELIDQRQKIFNAMRLSESQMMVNESENEPKDRREYKLTNIIRILVIKIGARRLGIAVDTIHGSEEILVKTLPSHIKGCNNYSGVTILGDGKVALILDPSGIIENANLRYIDDRSEVNSKFMISEAIKMRENQNILLFKCSGLETYALDMAMISRVEEIKFEDIECIGDKEYIKFRGEPLRIIRPENYILGNKKPKKRSDCAKYSVIIPKLVKYPMGILIEKIQDTILTSINLSESESIHAKGLIGSTIINKKIVLLLNIYELFELANPEQYAMEVSEKIIQQVKVLLVEDTPFFQNMEKSYLENAGYDVTVADNGKIALNLLESSSFDIVVSDIVMPEMDGLELIRRIRADKTLSKIPVVAVTSLTGELQIKEGMQAGFDAYEFKLDRSRLLAVIKDILAKRGLNHD